MKKTYRQLIEEAVLKLDDLHGKFTTKDVFNEVKSKRASAHYPTIVVTVTRDLTKNGFVRKTGRQGKYAIYQLHGKRKEIFKRTIRKLKQLEKRQAQQKTAASTLSMVEVGVAISDYVEDMKLKIKTLEREVKKRIAIDRKSRAQHSAQFQEKEKQIKQLNDMIIKLNNENTSLRSDLKLNNTRIAADRTFKLGDVARIRKV